VKKRIFTSGNEAVGYGAILAGCTHYFGYPITPQNEIIEFFAREFPKLGRVFVQSGSEITSINMLYGAAAAGVRAMTSTSSTAFSLMQEGISAIAAAELPCVIVNVQRGGPGAGTTQTAQMDYFQATRGAHGDYYNIVLAPASVQENADFVQLAFYLADKYRHPVIMLTDSLIGQMGEDIELQTREFGPLPEKEWALRGSAKRGYKRSHIHNYPGFGVTAGSRNYLDFLNGLGKKYQAIKSHEVRYQTYYLEDVDLALVAYGSSARSALGATYQARQEGYKVGLIRPITLWPFPTELIKNMASRINKFLVVEDSLGQMVEDVKAAVEGKAEVHFLGVLARHLPDTSGMIFPTAILKEVKKLL
jgi:2-oxoglutarate ferredoxin oxidoreductase subunit alpha